MKNPEQINRLIAEKCMGWHKPAKGRFWAESYGNYSGFMQEEAHIGLKFDPYHRIEHAHVAIDKIKEKWCEVHIFYRFEDQPDDGWYCWIGYNGKFHSHGCATPSAAICEAIVAAVEGKGESDE